MTRRPRAKLSTCAAVAFALAASSIARAAPEASLCPPPPGDREWVRVTFSDGVLGAADDGAVAAALASELAQHDLAVCVGPDRGAAPAHPPLAQITIRARSVDALVIRIAIDDGVTQKTVGRDLALGALPKDARALGISFAIDELLRASWLETAMSKRSARAPEPPLAVKEVVRESLPASVSSETLAPASADAVGAEHRGALAIFVAGEHAGGGQTTFGFDARAALALSSRIALALRFGYRSALPESTTHGTVDASLLLVGASVSFALTPPARPLGLGSFVRADLSREQLAARPNADARASSGSAIGAQVGAGLAPWLRLGGAWRLHLELGLAAPLRAVAATDDGRRASATTGVTFASALGVSAEF